MEMQKQRTCIAKEVQIVEIITIVQIQENMEMRYTRRARTVTRAVVRGTAITLAFLARAILSSNAEAFTIMVRVQACSVSATTMVIATASIRSVRSWSHFDVTTKYTSKTRIKAPNLFKNDKINNKHSKTRQNGLKRKIEARLFCACKNINEIRKHTFLVKLELLI